MMLNRLGLKCSVEECSDRGVERQGGSFHAMPLANLRCMQIQGRDPTKNIIMEDSTDTFVKKFNGEETFGVGEEAVSNGSCNPGITIHLL